MHDIITHVLYSFNKINCTRAINILGGDVSSMMILQNNLQQKIKKMIFKQ